MREKVKILHDSYLALYGIAKKLQIFSSALRKKVKCVENIKVFSSQTTIYKTFKYLLKNQGGERHPQNLWIAVGQWQMP